MADPYKSLAAAFREQMTGYAKDMLSGMSTELGTITASGLKLDNFKHEIKSYLVADFPVTLEVPAFHMVGTMMSPVDQEGYPLGVPGPRTRFEFEAAEIKEVRANLAAGLQPGDRVVAVNMNGGHEVVVMCRVVSQGG